MTTTTLRTSPIPAEPAHPGAVCGEHNDMPVLLRAGGEDAPAVLIDLSCLRRWGVKGPQAAAWLALQGVDTPPETNQWRRIDDDGVICRLGGSEFLIEDGWDGSVSTELSGRYRYGTAGVYPVLRQDAALALTGVRAGELLVQVCSFNFAAMNAGDPTVVMTTMVGVGVTVIVQEGHGSPVYRIWCDGTYGPFLWETLLGIAKELGGGAAGIGKLYPGALDA